MRPRFPVAWSLRRLNNAAACDINVLCGNLPVQILILGWRLSRSHYLSSSRRPPSDLAEESFIEMAPPDKAMLGNNPPIPGGRIFCPGKFKASRLPSGWFIFPDLGNAHSFWKEWNWPRSNLVTISEDGWVNAAKADQSSRMDKPRCCVISAGTIVSARPHRGESCPYYGGIATQTGMGGGHHRTRRFTVNWNETLSSLNTPDKKHRQDG